MGGSHIPFRHARRNRTSPPRLLSYDWERENYRPLAPPNFNAVTGILDTWAREAPDDLALLSLDGGGDVVDAITVQQLVEESRRAACALQAIGIRRGDHVFVMLPRVSGWYFAMLGAIRLGAVPMPAPNMLTSKDIRYRLDMARAVAAITDASGVPKVDEAARNSSNLQYKVQWSGGDCSPCAGWTDLGSVMRSIAPDADATADTRSSDALLIYFTSGTVGYPKMVEHEQSYALAHVATARFWHDLGPGDLHWTVADTGWAKAAWGSLFGQWHERATVVQVALGRADANTVLSILEKQRITSFCAPPTLYRQLIQADLSRYDLSSLRHCTSAGEPLNPEVIRIWRDGTGGLTVFDGYGQTETTVLVANYRSVPVRPGSMGKPVPGYVVDIRDANGGPVADDTPGAIAVRTAPHPLGLFHGYYSDPDATAARFIADWYFTGDRGIRDKDGYIWFEGRDDDVITSSGYRIGPFEVESALIEHPAIAEAAVVGRPDPDRTEIVCAFVVLTPGYAPSVELTASIQAHAKGTTAPYKYPREIQYVRELPKTVSGKIRRAELRQRLRDAVARDSAPKEPM